ncbi:MAG: TolC family protein [Bacteroidota bacterium]
MLKIKIISAFVFITSCVQAQINSVALQEIYSLLKENQISINEKPVASVRNIDALLATNFVIRENYQKEIFDEELRKLHSNVGLRLSASAQENLGGGFEDETRTFTATRASLGLEWNILGNGYRSNRLKSKSIENDKLIYELEFREVQRQENYFFLYNLFIYFLNEEKQTALEGRIDFLENLIGLYQKLEASHLAPKAEILLLEQKYKKSKDHLASFKAYNSSMKFSFEWLDTLSSVKRYALPVLDIDLGLLLENNPAGNINEEKKKLFAEELIYRQKDDNLIDFKVFARYNYSRLSQDLGNRKYPSIGASLSLPVTFKMNGNRKIYELEYKKLEQQLEFQEKNREKELMNHFYEYRYTLNQFTENSKKIETMEYKITIDSVKLEIENFISSPLPLIQHLENHSELVLASLDIKQKLYLKLLKIYTLSGHSSLNQFSEPMTFEKEGKTIKSLVLNSLPNSYNFLNSYIRLNDIVIIYSDLELKEITEDVVIKPLKDMKNLLVPVSDFEDLWSLEAFIQGVSSMSSEIILEDWKSLERLELASLKRQL